MKKKRPQQQKILKILHEFNRCLNVGWANNICIAYLNSTVNNVKCN
jgi:hypothetical protein